MRHAVADFGAFGVVEPLHRTDEVARDAPDALELHAVADLAVYDGEMIELSHGCCTVSYTHLTLPTIGAV